MADLEGKVAIVTGGARGIGAATATALSAADAFVLIADVIDEEGQALARKIAGTGKCARYVHLDVTDETQWETVAGWDKVIAVNQKGVWLGMKHAVPAMRTAGGGSIVNVSSIFGAVGGFGGSVAYHATKGAVRLIRRTRPSATRRKGSG